eukprot:TRINITY_DN4339_c0_g1_i3.p1 TRINITY_DN4339_c0_g1~~TRINITY_DN4339_c0_g1_i3.p1  ORF type:complete len:106 (+),score=30.85 TRINITY_DN4339_c0_g1_i3:456-773(+)
MARGEISELEDGSGFFKIKYNYELKTTYELQNRSNKPLTVTFAFFDLENLRIESERGKIEGNKVTLRVKPGETTHFVDLVTIDESLGWHYNYDPTWEAEDTPAWL